MAARNRQHLAGREVAGHAALDLQASGLLRVRDVGEVPRIMTRGLPRARQ
jgi:hypothetical protein